MCVLVHVRVHVHGGVCVFTQKLRFNLTPEQTGIWHLRLPVRNNMEEEEEGKTEEEEEEEGKTEEEEEEEE